MPDLKFYTQGYIFRMAMNHEMHVKGRGWVPASELRVGDWLTNFNEAVTRIEQSSELPEDWTPPTIWERLVDLS